MTDNDIRGFLDGGFIWGWNQATQIHLRIGRSDVHSNPMYGEMEVFRALFRWQDIELPPGARCTAFRLTLGVEGGPARALRLLVYAVARDWNPGAGGVDENNVSVPKPGEVWWRDAAYLEDPWGHPGAGFASDSHPEADTGASALAEAIWTPDRADVVFQSAALASYATERIGQGKPILLLLKLADVQEDTPGCFLNLYSGEHGDSRNTVRRPRLELEWESPAEVESVSHDLFLEYGRVCELPKQSSEDGLWAVSFDSSAGYAPPALQIREGTGDDPGPWRRAPRQFQPEREWFQVRVLAMPDPIELGDCFEAGLEDAGVLTGPAEGQSVPWFFESPTGAVHTVEAEYLGRHRWSVRFVPDEAGTWSYFWTQEFLLEPYRSPDGQFCVWGGSMDQVMRHLDLLEESVGEASREARHRYRLALYALEREGMRLLAPDDLRGAPGEMFRASIRRIRSGLWRKPVPEPIPMLSHQLVHEVDGVALQEPLLDASRYRSRREKARRANRMGIRKRLRRLAGRIVRGKKKRAAS